MKNEMGILLAVCLVLSVVTGCSGPQTSETTAREQVSSGEEVVAASDSAGEAVLPEADEFPPAARGALECPEVRAAPEELTTGQKRDSICEQMVGDEDNPVALGGRLPREGGEPHQRTCWESLGESSVVYRCWNSDGELLGAALRVQDRLQGFTRYFPGETPEWAEGEARYNYVAASSSDDGRCARTFFDGFSRYEVVDDDLDGSIDYAERIVFDERGRLHRRDVLDDKIGAYIPKMERSYEGNAFVERWFDAERSVTKTVTGEVDKAGRVTKEATESEGVTRLLERRYDSQGREVRVAADRDGDGEWDVIERRRYDSDGALVREEIENRERGGRKRARTLVRGPHGPVRGTVEIDAYPAVPESWEYDEQGRLTERRTVSGGEVLEARRWEWDDEKRTVEMSQARQVFDPEQPPSGQEEVEYVEPKKTASYACFGGE